jgi:ribosomal protein S27AE
MGRVRKSVVDKIVRLRKQGYTQVEAAEKAGVHLKTVQKHDPLRKSKKTTISPSIKGEPFTDLQSDIKTLGDWVESLRWTLKYKMDVDLLCPKCSEGIVDDDDTGTFICQKCGYKMKALGSVWKSDQKSD